MRKTVWCLLPVVSLILVACGPGGGPAVSTPAAVATREAAKPAAGTKWETILAEGKKEGTVRIYTFWNPAARKALSEAFSPRYGINLEFVVGRGSELQPKILAEQRAGLYLADIIGLGTNSLLVNMKPLGLLGPIEPLLILPEVLDSKAWPEGKVPFSDNDRTAIPMTANAQRYFIYNKTLIKEGELTAYMDVLNPKYKGKIIVNDPSIQGSGNAFFSHLARNVLSVEQAKDFFKRLLTELEAPITRDYRGQVESVAKGKYAIGLGTQSSSVIEFVGLGAPIGVPPVKEVEMSHESGVLSVARVMAHPNATTVFINWLLTQEGQTVFSKNAGTAVLRRGIPTEGVNPIFLIQPGDKAAPDTEEYIMFKGEMAKVAKELVDAFAK